MTRFNMMLKIWDKDDEGEIEFDVFADMFEKTLLVLEADDTKRADSRRKTPRRRAKRQSGAPTKRKGSKKAKLDKWGRPKKKRGGRGAGQRPPPRQRLRARAPRTSRATRTTVMAGLRMPLKSGPSGGRQPRRGPMTTVRQFRPRVCDVLRQTGILAMQL